MSAIANKSLYEIPLETGIVNLICAKAFEGLSDTEKKYATFIAGASWKGALICLFQTSPESPYIFAMLRYAFNFAYEAENFSQSEDIDSVGKEFKTSFLAASSNDTNAEESYNQVMIYIASFFANLGNYKSFGDTKFVPACSRDDFQKIIEAAATRSNTLEKVKALWEKVSSPMFALEPSRIRSIGFGPKEGLSTYFSSNCTKEDAEKCQRFLDQNKISAYNTRLFKIMNDDNKTTFHIKIASAMASTREPIEFEGAEFVVITGDHAAFMQKAVALLREAAKVGANKMQESMLNLYAECFEKGDLQKHIEGSRSWIKDKGPAVESYIGFIESYQDPFGTRGEWEGFVAVVNRETSAKFQTLVDAAESFLPLLPWPESFEKDKFQRPDFTSLEVLAFGSSGIPAGINIPNYNEVRQVDGFKNVSLGNVLASAYKPKKSEAVTFIQDEDVELYQTLVTEAFEVQVGLHELLGHGSGKMFMGDDAAEIVSNIDNPLNKEKKVELYYKTGETYDSKFGSMGSSYEECRAECVGMSLCPNKTVLKIFGHEGQNADDICYINWLHMARAGILALLFWSPETKRWGQAHMQARFAILQCMLEAGNDFVSVEKNDKNETYLKMDRSKIESIGKPAVDQFLLRIQVYKATANFEAASEMYNKYTNVNERFQELRNEVIARRKPRKMFVQPNLLYSEEKKTIVLEEYAPTSMGIIQSFMARYRLEEMDEILKQADAEANHHQYY